MDERETPGAERVRADLARLGRDGASAPDVPPAVTDQVVSALRAARSQASSPSPQRRRAVRLGAAAGVTAVVVAAGLGAVSLVSSETGRPARHTIITASPSPAIPPPAIPLSDSEILALLNTPADLGPLGDPRRRASCLSGLGYPGSPPVLGGRPLAMLGQPAVLLVLADESVTGDTRREIAVVALAVRPNCSVADTGLLAETQIRRP